MGLCDTGADHVTRLRNMSIVLGCIAEKLAGPRLFYIVF